MSILSNSNVEKSPQDQVYDYVRERIMTMAFKPGSLITDTQLSNTLNLSRSPVREALHRLTNDGMLRYEFGRGWKVYALTLDDIREIFEIKIALESVAARNAAACKDDALRTDLQSALTSLCEAGEAKNSEAWWAAEAKLSNLILEMAKNQRIAVTIHKLNNQWYRVRMGFLALNGRMERAENEYTEIVASILNQQPDKAGQLMSEHLDHISKELANLLANMVLPFVEEGV